MLDAITVIAQYARDQAVVSARDQASLSTAASYGSRRTQICLGLRRTVSWNRIIILRLPDNYNRRTGLQTRVGGARMHCMHACVGELICTDILDTSLKLLIIKKSHQQQEN